MDKKPGLRERNPVNVRVSVVISYYNQGKYLGEAVGSVFKSGYKKS